MGDERRQRILSETRLQGGTIYCPADNKLVLSSLSIENFDGNYELELLSAGIIKRIKTYADPQGSWKY